MPNSSQGTVTLLLTVAAAEAHARDLEVQGKYGVKYTRYWYDESGLWPGSPPHRDPRRQRHTWQRSSCSPSRHCIDARAAAGQFALNVPVTVPSKCASSFACSDEADVGNVKTSRYT